MGLSQWLPLSYIAANRQARWLIVELGVSLTILLGYNKSTGSVNNVIYSLKQYFDKSYMQRFG